MTTMDFLEVFGSIRDSYILEAKNGAQTSKRPKPENGQKEKNKQPLTLVPTEEQYPYQARKNEKRKKKGFKKFLILSAAVALLLATLAGRGYFTQWTEYFSTFLEKTQEQNQYAEPTEETTGETSQPTVAPTELPSLTKECDPNQICLAVRPTDMTTSGDEFYYYVPDDQEEWVDAYEMAQSKADPDRGWEEGYSGSGIWICYQDNWWEALADGDILTRNNGRIDAADCTGIYRLAKDAATRLGLKQPVRPDHIHNIRSATLDFNGSYTISDPEKLAQLELWLSNSTELYGGANCWFTALLTLEMESGETVTISMATDSCATWFSEGVFYQYDLPGNEAFYALFQVDVLQKEEGENSGSDTVAMEDAQLVRVVDYVPGLSQELGYASENNFTKQKIYSFEDAYLRYGTVKKLMKVSEELSKQGLHLLIWDAFRPVSAQQKLWEICPDPTYVSHPVTGNRNHCRGSAVDVTLVDEHGNMLEMPSEFDDFTEKADRDYSDCTAEAGANAQLLQDIMEQCGFAGYSQEWWHFNDTDSYPVDELFEPQPITMWYAECEEFISLRQTASSSSEVITRIPKNDQFSLLAWNGDFGLINYQGTTGYVMKNYIQPVQ